jgi:hypothetical protein
LECEKVESPQVDLQA